MKKVLSVLALVAFSTALSVQAGGDACCTKTKTSASAKSTCNASAKSTAAKSACCASDKQAKSNAPATARGTLLAKN